VSPARGGWDGFSTVTGASSEPREPRLHDPIGSALEQEAESTAHASVMSQAPPAGVAGARRASVRTGQAA
jgi:hypothetical protein